MAEERVSVTLRARDLASRVLTGIRGRMQRLRQSVFSLKGAMVGLGTAFAAGRIGQSLINAFTKQQDAVVGLGSALEQTGKSGSAALEQLTRNASNLQRVTRQGDEAILAATESLTLLAPALNTSELERGQQAIVGLGEGLFKGDINAAAQMLGKTIGGTTNALSRYGIEVDMSGSATDRLNQILEQSARYFEVAKDKTKTVGGSIQQLSNAFGDLKETLGGILADMLGLTDRTGGLTEKTFGLIDAIEENRSKIVAWGQVALRSLGLVGQAFKTVFRVAYESGQMIGRVFEIGLSTISAGLLTMAVKVGQGFQGMINTAVIRPINWMLEQLDKLPVVSIDFRIGELQPTHAMRLMEAQAETFFENAAEQSQNLRDDISELGDTLGNLGRSWQGVADAAGRAWEAQSGAANVTPEVPAAAPPLARVKLPFGPLEAPLISIDGGTAKKFDVGDTVGKLGNALGTMEGAAVAATDATDQMATTVINAFAQMGQAAQQGSGGLLGGIIGGAAGILSAIPGVGTVASAGILAGGGLLSSLVSGGGSGPLAVKVDSYGSNALSSMRDLQEREINFTAIIRSDGAEVWRINQALLELTRQDGTFRILPVGGFGG